MGAGSARFACTETELGSIPNHSTNLGNEMSSEILESLKNAKHAMSPDQNAWRKDIAFNALPKADYKNHILEFGVYEGRSISILASIWKDKTIYGFDSFYGLPEEWKIQPDKTHSIGHYSAHGELPIVPDNVHLFVGMFKYSIPEWKQIHKGPISIIHIDCDIYSSTITILEELNNQIEPGTVIFFDELWPNLREFSSPPEPSEFYSEWEQHEWKALIEWLDKYDRDIEILYTYGRDSVAVRVTK